ncbi:MAG: hypothetical protein ACKOKB_09840 [Bacteroidota bacterium]
MSTEKGYKKTVHNFYERQSRVKSWPYFLSLIFIGITTVWLAFKITEHRPFVLSTFGYWPHMAAVFLFSCYILFRFHLSGVVTAINEQGVFVKRAPFQKNFTMMLWEDIKEIRLVEFKGYRSAKKYSQVFDLGTPNGIELLSRSGRKKYISTRKTDTLPRILARMAPGRFKSTGIGEQMDLKED